MRRKKQLIAIFLSALVIIGCAGCNGSKKASGDGDNKITWWIANRMSSIVKSYDEVAGMQEIQKKLGIDIEFFHPSTEQETEQFNIMAASGEFKDLITYNWNGYSGGAAKAAADGAILVLDDYLEEHMPNLLSLMKEDSDVNYIVRTSEGTVCVIPSFTDNLITTATFGPMIRKDWLDKLGLEVPETIDDWYKVLTAFKTQDPNGNGKQDEIPIAASNSATFLRFSRAFGGVMEHFYVDGDGKVRYGFIEDDYKKFLTVINKWYKEGLIDPEYAAAKGSMETANIVGNISGVFIGYSSNMVKYMIAGRETNPEFTLVAAQWPTTEGGAPYCGDTYQGKRGTLGKGTAVFAKSKNIENSLKVLDYMYGEEGSTYLNWGIEGETYEKTEDGLKFTELVTNNPEGKTPVEAVSKYAMTQWCPTLMRSDAFMPLNNVYPEQKEAMQLWNEADISRIMPTLSLRPEEREVNTKYMDDILMYRIEWVNKFVMGVEPLSKFDDVAAEIRKMGIQEVIDVYQQAYDRYKNQ